MDAQGNPHQEDSLFPAYGQQKDTDRLFVLCDGMGGHDAGEVASATVCEAMSKSVMASVPDAEALFTDDMLQKAIASAFDVLDERDNGTAVKKMGTTMTFLKLHAGGATIAHMGDSRVYHIRPGEDAAHTQILFHTEDHSLVNDLVKVGELTPEEARVSPQKNIITRAMQPHMERRPRAEVKHITDIRPGDYFYMCTDGMLEQMDDSNIRFNFSAMTGDDANKVRVLTEATHYNRDNHTAFIIHILDVEGQPSPNADVDEDEECFLVEAEDGEEPQPAGQGSTHEVPVSGSGTKKGHGAQRKKGWLASVLSNQKNVYLVGLAFITLFAAAYICTLVPKKSTHIIIEQPVKPDTPAGTGRPDKVKPPKRSKPSGQEQPAKPDKPDKPAKPDKPDKPTAADTPDKEDSHTEQQGSSVPSETKPSEHEGTGTHGSGSHNNGSNANGTHGSGSHNSGSNANEIFI